MILPAFRCRSCGSDRSTLVLDLGSQPLANRLPAPSDLDQPEPRFPLRLLVCQSCWLCQISDVIPPETLFSDYLYFTSNSDTMMRHARDAAARYTREFSLGPSSRVIEIASNDGYLLTHFLQVGVPCLGIEPAANIAAAARTRGIPTLAEFFDSRLARRLAADGQRADLVLGNNVFAHVPDINDFVAGLAAVLQPRGRAILEFPYAVDLLERNEFDTIYHEHVFYFSLTALEPVFARHGLAIVRIERIPIHGGSLRLFASPAGGHAADETVAALRAIEHAKGVDRLGFYAGFGRQVEAIRQSLRDLLARLRREGRSIAAYGASAKGSTMLNFFGLGADTIEFIADRSPHKQGRLSPGMHIPIVPPDRILERQPDYMLLLTWNFAEEILAQQSEYRRRGGRFIIPIPSVQVV